MTKLGFGSLFAMLFLVGCGAQTAQLQNGDGNLLITSVESGQLVTPTEANPLPVHGVFSVEVYEDHYTGPFTVDITTTQSTCFTAASLTNTGSPTITFTPTNAVVPTATSIDPCSVGNEEQALISDTKGHSRTIWYALTDTIE